MNRQRLRWSMGVATLALLLLGSVNLVAQDEDPSIEEKLALSQTQKSQISELRDQFKSDAAPHKAKIREFQKQLKELKDGGDDEKRAIMKQMADHEISLDLLLQKFVKDYLAILTTEQKAKLKELKGK